MCGLPGSGKSTIIENFIDSLDCPGYFSSDQYRKILLGDETRQDNNDLVFKTLYADLISHLKLGYDAILDATNVTIKSRSKILNLLKNNKLLYNDVEKICYVVNTPVDVCIERDAARNRCVGESVIKKFLYQFQCPQYFEGWDKIEFANPPHFQSIYSDENFALINELFYKMDRFKQFNPHHKYSVGEHSLNLFKYFDGKDKIRASAGRFHDIGKLYTQQFDDYNIAHYYNHDAVGAYFVLSNPSILLEENLDNILEIIFYINWHMRAHNDINATEKAKKKYVELFGQERYDKLMEFAKADKITSGCSHRYNEIKEYINNLKETGGKYDGRIFK